MSINNWSSLIYTNDHDLYVCGSNEYGQLGFPSSSHEIEQPIKLMHDENIKMINDQIIEYTWSKKNYVNMSSYMKKIIFKMLCVFYVYKIEYHINVVPNMKNLIFNFVVINM